MAGLFLLLVIIMMLIFYRQRTAAMIFIVIGILFSLAIFWEHVTDIININL